MCENLFINEIIICVNLKVWDIYMFENIKLKRDILIMVWNFLKIVEKYVRCVVLIEINN